jgi:gliding motility-associated-like protein
MPVLCSSATVFLCIDPVNDAPVAVNDTVPCFNEDSSVQINVLANDTDVDGNINPASVTIVTPPVNGTVTVNAVSGVVTYTPNANFFGNDQFTYSVCDSGMPVLCSSATVFLCIDPVNDAPVALNDSACVEEGFMVIIPILDNDFDIEGNLDPASATIITAPLNGVVLVDPVTGELMYTPNAGFTGLEIIQYQVCDSGVPVLCSTAWVYINVYYETTTIKPTAVNDEATSYKDMAIFIPILANDTVLNGHTVSIISSPINGTATFNSGTDLLSYDPDPGYVGLDSVQYQLCYPWNDCDGNTVELCDTAWLYITIEDNREPTLTVPQGFSPNGDGLNDFLVIPGIENYPNNKLMIFNRWGNKVFEKEGYLNEWDGKAKSGQFVFGGADEVLPTGTYFYILNLGVPDMKPLQGWIYIYR